MPTLKEVKKAVEIGKSGGCYIWVACPICKIQRWVSYRYYTRRPYERRGMCGTCAQRKPGAIPGFIDQDGYRQVHLKKHDFFLPMANKKNYIREHRLVVARRLGRCLQSWEIVHHINGIRDDNRDENLELTMRDDHNYIRRMGSFFTCPHCKHKTKITPKLFH